MISAVESSTFLVTAVDWSIFGTLTFRAEPGREETAIAAGLDWLCLIRQRTSCPVKRWYWLLRAERGEAMGRLHLHVLIAIRPVYGGLFVVPAGCVSQAHKLWRRGLTSFRYVERGIDPVLSYMMKDSSGGDSYELQKTARARTLIASAALVKRAAGHAPKRGRNRTVGAV